MSVRLAIGALVALTLLAYASVWSADLVYDDANWLPMASASTWASWRAWSREPWALASWLGGGQPWALHGFVLALHLVNGGLLWQAVRPFVSRLAGLLVLTLFWLHPLQTESVAYVTGGMEALLTTYVLTAVLGLRSARAWAMGVGVGALLLAASLKWSALPVLLLLPFVVGPMRSDVARAAWLALGTLGATVAWPAAALWLRDAAASWPERWAALQALAVALCRLIGAAAWPSGLSLEHDASRSMWVGGLALVAVGTAGVLAWRARASWAAPWWAWLWIVGLVAPRALVRDAPLTEHHTYLPFLAVWLLAGVALDRFLLSERTVRCA